LLKVATTTTAKIRTRRLNPQRRRRKDLFDYGKQHIPLLALNSHSHTIAGRRKRNEDSLSIRMGQPHATRKNPFNVNLKPHSDPF
jgi:hypothetical protein